MNDIDWLSLHAIYTVLVVVAAAGICLNAVLLLTTALTTSLRSTAHILIGCCALFDILHEIGYFVQFPILFSEYYIDSFVCSCMQFIPSLGRSAGVVCAFCIGIDRMLYMFDVAAYDRMKKKHMLAYHFLSIALFCMWTLFLMVANWTPRQQICTMLAPFHGDSRVLWWNTISGIYILTSLIYFVAWQTVKWRVDAASQRHHDNLFTSTTVVIIVEVSAWFISSILVDLSRHYVAPDHRPPIHYLSCVIVSSGIAAKPILLYLLCMVKHLRLSLMCIFGVAADLMHNQCTYERNVVFTHLREKANVYDDKFTVHIYENISTEDLAILIHVALHDTFSGQRFLHTPSDLEEEMVFVFYECAEDFSEVRSLIAVLDRGDVSGKSVQRWIVLMGSNTYANITSTRDIDNHEPVSKTSPSEPKRTELPSIETQAFTVNGTVPKNPSVSTILRERRKSADEEVTLFDEVALFLFIVLSVSRVMVRKRVIYSKLYPCFNNQQEYNIL